MSKQKKTQRKKQSFVTLDKTVHAMRISPGTMEGWIRDRKIQPIRTKNGPAIPEIIFKKIAHSPDTLNAVFQAAFNEALRRQKDDTNGSSHQFNIEISNVVEEYLKYVHILENIHRKYHDRFNIITDQSPTTAAYIVLSRAISLLHMACLCLENHYWEVLVLLRPIDEALQLAEYFLVSANTPNGKKKLGEWFRENKSPSNSDCRTALDHYARSQFPTLNDDILGNAMNEVYQAKSKPVHNALNNIIEVYNTRVDGKTLIGVGFDYGPCSYLRKIFELLDFFRSSIWSTVQSFLFWFRLGDTQIDQNDLNTLIAMDQEFLKAIDRGLQHM